MIARTIKLAALAAFMTAGAAQAEPVKVGMITTLSGGGASLVRDGPDGGIVLHEKHGRLHGGSIAGSFADRAERHGIECRGNLGSNLRRRREQRDRFQWGRIRHDSQPQRRKAIAAKMPKPGDEYRYVSVAVLYATRTQQMARVIAS